MIVGQHADGNAVTFEPDGPHFTIGAMPVTLEQIRFEDSNGRIVWASETQREWLLGSPRVGTAPSPVAKAGWFTSLKTWQKALFILLWPIAATYGVYWMWKDKKFTQGSRIGLTAVFALAMIISTVTYGQTLSPRGATTPTSATSPRTTTTSTSPTASSPAPPTTAAPIKSEGELLNEAIRFRLGDSNRKVDRVSDVSYANNILIVRFAINDNLNQKMINTGARINVTDILKIVQNSGIPVAQVQVRGTYSMVDKLGNASETVVINALYAGDTIRKINFENFSFDNVWSIAEDAVVHPIFL